MSWNNVSRSACEAPPVRPTSYGNTTGRTFTALPASTRRKSPLASRPTPTAEMTWAEV
jgi:hypothetical protein